MNARTVHERLITVHEHVAPVIVPKNKLFTPLVVNSVNACSYCGARLGRPANDCEAQGTTSPPTGPPDLSDSPLYLLAVLCAARRSNDRALERVTRRRLDRLGIRIAFGNELPAPKRAKGGRTRG